MPGFRGGGGCSGPEPLYSTLTNANFDTGATFERALDLGGVAIEAMDLLDEALTEVLGTPEPKEVPETDIEGRAILVTGHDLSPQAPARTIRRRRCARLHALGDVSRP